MFAAQEVYRVLGNESLWNVAEQCHAQLSAAQVA